MDPYQGTANNPFGPGGSDWWGQGYFYLGPLRIPPTPPTVGMTDRAGTGQVWYLMWDGENHLVLTNVIPTYAQGDYYVFQPYDGPYLGSTGWRMGVTTALQAGQLLPAGTPHLLIDFPASNGGGAPGSGHPHHDHPLVAPNINAPGAQRYPESTGWPAPQPPTVPGIPSSSPVPSGGGFAAFQDAFATNAPPLVSSTYVTGVAGVLQPYHIAQWGGGAV